jgi:hypothetical protein
MRPALKGSDAEAQLLKFSASDRCLNSFYAMHERI